MVGGLDTFGTFFIVPKNGNFIIPIDELICFIGRYTMNQRMKCTPCLLLERHRCHWMSLEEARDFVRSADLKTPAHRDLATRNKGGLQHGDDRLNIGKSCEIIYKWAMCIRFNHIKSYQVICKWAIGLCSSILAIEIIYKWAMVIHVHPLSTAI